MSYPQVFILSLVQGLAEFLPISSSGHLVILQKLFNFSSPPVLFDILVHVGTLGAVLVYFRKELVEISRKTIWLVIIGTIPAALVGGLFEKNIEVAFNSLQAVGLALLFTAGLLFSTKWVKIGKKQFNYLKWHDGVFIGIFQALAILPGISRSGSTIVSGLWRGAERATAFRFSFYLAIPAILGALVLKSGELMTYSTFELVQGMIGMLIAGIVGYFALRILENVLKSAKLFWFGIYCLVLGIIVLIV